MATSKDYMMEEEETKLFAVTNFRKATLSVDSTSSSVDVNEVTVFTFG